MLNERQRMQVRRSIGYQRGFYKDSVVINNISNVPNNIVIDGGSVEIEVDFSHKVTGYSGKAYFKFNPSDMRKMPIFLRINN